MGLVLRGLVWTSPCLVKNQSSVFFFNTSITISIVGHLAVMNSVMKNRIEKV